MEGYGALRIIDQLDFSTFVRHPKWIIGYSDITVLHNAVHNLGVESLHAIMPVDLENTGPSSLETLHRALFGDTLEYVLPPNPQDKQGTGKGPLVGGNLSLLYAQLGSETTLNTRGKILFLEDLDEYLYHIDRMLINLKRNCYFDELQGLVIGGMIDMHDNTVPFGKEVSEIVLDTVSEYDFPVVFNFLAGHICENNALILGREAALTVAPLGTDLKFKDGGPAQ